MEYSRNCCNYRRAIRKNFAKLIGKHLQPSAFYVKFRPDQIVFFNVMEIDKGFDYTSYECY